MAALFTTPLHDWHVAHGARMTPFAGWDMPVQYESILVEHQQTRTMAAVFDIGHMGEFLLSGKGARQALSRIVAHNLETLPPGRCRYGFLLNDQGGVLDDLIIYCLGVDSYMLVVNAACAAGDYARIAALLPPELHLEDVSADTAKIDLQGPQSLSVLEKALAAEFRDLSYFAFRKTEFAGAPVLVSRTGYTGELGYELYTPADKALEVWNACLADERVKPAGLGARDTLRLEMGYPLYGHELDEVHTPAEAGYAGLLTSSAEYPGRGGDRRITERLVALSVNDRRSPRTGDAVLLPSGETVGRVTSESFGPSLGHAIALAFVRADCAGGAEFLIQTPRTRLSAVRTELPFFRQGTARQVVAPSR